MSPYNEKLLIFSSFEIILSLFFGLITVFLTFKLTDWFVLKRDIRPALRKGLTSVALFQGTVIVVTLILMENAVLPAVNTLQGLVSHQKGFAFSMIWITLIHFAKFYGLAFVITTLTIFSSMGLYMVATRTIDEMREIRTGNMAVSVLLCFIILGMALLVRAPMGHLLGSLVDYNIGLESGSKIQLEPRSD